MPSSKFSLRLDGPTNVGTAERALSLLAGGILALDGLRRRTPLGALEAVLAAALVERGVTGHCRVYHAMGMSTAEEAGAAEATPARRMVLVQQAHTIAKDPDTLYRAWRDFEGLPRVMKHLESVTETGERTSHWVARAPAGRTIEWDAEISEDVPGRRIAWHSIEGSEVAHAGSVSFHPAPAGRGTEVHVTLQYAPPGGELGARLARFFREEPEHQIREDLRRFKQWIETGEIATTEGQPVGSRQ
ncbi:MAG TPA: SRPBCC family protein [Solirubrobacterales bacterium]